MTVYFDKRIAHFYVYMKVFSGVFIAFMLLFLGLIVVSAESFMDALVPALICLGMLLIDVGIMVYYYRMNAVNILFDRNTIRFVYADRKVKEETLDRVKKVEITDARYVFVLESNRICFQRVYSPMGSPICVPCVEQIKHVISR